MSKYDRHKELCDLLNETYIKKNHDYGDSFHLSYLEEGMAMPRIRLSDKLNRFKALSKGAERKVQDESMIDTLLDLANYALMTVLEIEEQADMWVVKPYHEDDKLDSKYSQDSASRTSASSAREVKYDEQTYF